MDEELFTVLIADDEGTNRNGLCRAIPWETYHAEVIGTAEDGITALAAVRRSRPDLVIIDIKMPGMDGLEVIRQAHEEGIVSRFIIVSGYDDFHLAQKAIRYGAKAYFLKPIRIGEFRDELSRQFAELMLERSMGGSHRDVSALLGTSRLFLMNQLLSSELVSAADLARRCSQLNVKLAPESPCFCAVIIPLTEDAELRRRSLEQAMALMSRELEGKNCELWLRGNESLIALCDAGLADRIPFGRITAELRRLQDVRCIACRGPVVATLLHSAESYSAAMRSAGYSLYEQPGDVYDSSMICSAMPPRDITERPVCEQALQAIETGDEAMLDRAADGYLDRLFYVPMSPPDYVYGKCTALLSSLCALLNARHGETGAFDPPRAETARRIHTVPELRSWVKNVMRSYAAQYEASVRRSDPLVEAAKEYIRQHLSENVKASDVAARINLSTYYFTTCFKNRTGCNFRDYVLQEKMNYARELLQSQRMSISEVAYATGYVEYRSFSRAFKNVMGHAPSDYQRPVREQDGGEP